MTPKPPNPELAVLPNLFLLNEKNRPFVEGRSRRVAIWPPSSYFLTAVLLVTTIGVMIAVFNAISQWNIFMQQEQAETQGTVIARITGIRESGADGGSSPWYSITYRFSVPGMDMAYTETRSVDEDTYYRLSEGEAVTITYLRINPYISWITGHLPYTNPYIIGVPGVLILGSVTLLALTRSIRAAQRTGRLIHKGRLMKGEVEDWSECTKSDGEGGTYTEYTLKYRFYDPNRRPIWAKKKMIQIPKGLKVRTPLAVLYVNDRLYEVL